MTDYGDIINRSFGRSNPALPQTVGNIDEDPDKAQRALDLAKATGVSSTAIYGDLEEFERQHKAVMASDIVANNPHLSDFVQSNPMAPKIANDDYGTLDAVSQKLGAFAKGYFPLITAIPSAALAGATEGVSRAKEAFGPFDVGTWIKPEDRQQYPLLAHIATQAFVGSEIALRAASALAAGGIGAIHGAAEDFLGDLRIPHVGEGFKVSMGGPSISRDLAAIAEMYMQGGGPHMPHLPAVGLVPELDKARVDYNAKGLEQLKEATSEAQKSLVRERSPELFKEFINQHTEAEIGISGDAVAALYGEKLPVTDDGLLGWVPGISDKLALARETGTDIHIPLSDWLAHAEPELMQALHDDIRVRPNGITVREAQLAAEQKEPPPVPIAEPVPTTRAAAALEPLYSIGDRKLKLERMKLSDDGAPKSPYGIEQGFHDFQLTDEKGNAVGALNVFVDPKTNKQLYVESITGINGLGPRDFGPALMRDLLRQLKTEFPEAETITGHRVSGARDKAGSYMASSAQPVIKLDSPKGWSTTDLADWVRVLEGGQWETYSPRAQAYIKPFAERSVEDRQLINAVNEELDRIAPKKLAVQEADRIQARGIEGQAGEAITPTGMYLAYKDAYPILLYSLEGPDPIGTARHEAIHHLRRYGFFDNTEWGTLEQAAKDNKWAEQFGIDRRYPDAKPGLRLEESIADAYKEWEGNRDFQVTPEVHTLFEKMKAFFEALRKRISELLGKEPTWEDIFQKVSVGEVGAREGKPLDARAFDEKLSVPEEPSRVFERAAALGMTIDQFKAYDRLIAARHAEDIEVATKRAQEQKGGELTKEWKANRKDLRQEVAAEIKQRPDVAADLFLANGELYGKKLAKPVKLDSDSLTDAQKAMLPRAYYGKDGVHPDDVANLFGYGSGDAMIEKLGEYNVPKIMAKMSARDFVSRVTDMETDRQMQVRYGNLDENIVDAVKEQVVGQTQLDILHEETHALGMKVGQAPLDKGTIISQLQQKFAQMPLSAVSSDAYMRAAGKAGRNAELALLADDPAAAFQAKQQQYYATVVAHEAAQLEKELGKFEKVAKRFSAREVSSVDQQYTNFIHDILQRVGKPVRRSIQDIATEIQAGEYHTLQEFVEGKNGYYMREVAVADILYDPTFRKKFEDLTVDEFNAVNTSIKSMMKNGRDELKITKAGAEADLKEVKGQMINQLQQFQERTYDAKGGRWMGPIPPRMATLLRSYGIAHIQIENLFNRWDNDNPNGVFQQYVMRDLVNAANSESAKRKIYAAKLLETDDKADLKKMVDNPIFKAPNSDRTLPFNRANLRTVLLNMGNASNLDKLARGYKLEPDVISAWAQRHATKEDWDWAQKIGNIFAEIKDEADVMYRQQSGVAPESIPIKPIQTPHGQYPGWYYPLIAHPEFEGGSRKLMGKDALEQEGFVRATTANGYTKARTGAIYPLALDLDMLPARIAQMVHDVEMRPAVVNASKIFYDKDVRGAISKHFGNEWRDMLTPYLVDVANSANYMTKEQKRFANLSEFLRQNMITTLVGLNPGTFMKHTPTAAIQSLHEVGPQNFLRAVKSLFSINDRTGETNWQYAMRESEELQRRHQNYIETLGGATDQLMPDKGYQTLRATVQRFSAYPVAMGDLASAVPTWLAQYGKTLAEGESHGDAVYMADRAVRRAHGSTAITNRASVMRGGAWSPWLSSVYGFFNHIMNRQYEMVWKSGEMLDMAKEGEYREAMQKAPELTSMLFAYVLMPALIEEMVTPLASSDNESWGKKAAKGIAFTLGASWIGVRDIANAMLNFRDPSVGLVSTALKTITDPMRDLTKQAPFSKEHAGKLIKDASTLMGTATGLVPAQVGRTAEFGYGVHTGQERPRGPWGWLVGARYGTLTHHSGTFQEWQRHH